MQIYVHKFKQNLEHNKAQSFSMVKYAKSIPLDVVEERKETFKRKHSATEGARKKMAKKDELGKFSKHHKAKKIKQPTGP